MNEIGSNETEYDLATKGYSIIPDYLSKNTIQRLRELTAKAVSSFKPTENSDRSKKDRYLIHDLICQDLEFAKLLEDSRLQDLISPLLGHAWIMYALTSSSIPPFGENYSSRMHVDSPRFQPGYVTNVGVIWTLDEYREDNGALQVLPGSHHSSVMPSEGYFNRNSVKVLCSPGSLILFNARVVHRTGSNKTDEWRHSVTMNCCRCFMKQRMDWVRFVPEDISEKVNDQARRILGFDTRLPSSLEELFVPESDRLYKGNQE